MTFLQSRKFGSRINVIASFIPIAPELISSSDVLRVFGQKWNADGAGRREQWKRIAWIELLY